jgi:endoglucanase
MHDDAMHLLRELTEAHAVPGHEEEVREIFVREMSELGTVGGDRCGSVTCEFGDGPRVLLAGHMDEVGFMVQSITKEGFLRFIALGGWWSHTLLSQRVVVRTSSGRKVPGVIGSKPPHMLPESERRQVVQIEEMYIDVGAQSLDQVEHELGIRVGDPVAPWSPFTPLALDGMLLAKAFDNRVGMAAAIQAGRLLAEGGVPNRLVVAGTVQEEMGLRGARTLARVARPDVAVVLEGPPADDTPGGARGAVQGRLGGGVQIRMFDPSAISHPLLARLAIEVAEQEKIPHQVTVRHAGGTDAGAIQPSGEGVPSVVLGVPARYIHSHNAIIDLNDYLQMVALAAALVRRLDAETVAAISRVA